MSELSLVNSDLIGKVVSFDTYAQYILGNKYQRCKVMGILDADSARHISDISSLSVAIYPALPTGTPKDYKNYQYLKVALGNGKYDVVASEWIKKGTLKVHKDISVQITVSNINPSDIDVIRGVLAAYNYRDVVIAQV